MNGRRTGRTYSKCVASWIYLVGWCASVPALFVSRKNEVCSVRLTCLANTGSACSNHVLVCGNKAIPPIPMFGATSELCTSHHMLNDSSLILYREVKFGALMDQLTDGNCWLATGWLSDTGDISILVLEGILRSLRRQVMGVSSRSRLRTVRQRFVSAPYAFETEGQGEGSNLLPISYL